MKNKIKLTTLSLVTSILLVGCGSSDSTSNTTNTGYFIDSEVTGVEYKTTSGFVGLTDNYGKFQYHTGDKVKLSIGKLILGEVEPNTDGLITPKLLVVGDNSLPDENQTSTITLMLQTLQSLDSDGNSSNGITISSDVLDSLDTLNDDIHFSDINETYLIKLDNSYDLGLDEDYDGYLDINATEAKVHFQSSQDDWDHGKKPDDIIKQYSDESHGDFSISAYPITATLTDSLKNAIAYMGNEERLAYDVYMNLYNYHDINKSIQIKQLFNIASKSEIKHIEIVKDIVARYALDDTNLTVDINKSVIDINNTTLTKDSNITDIEVMGVYKIEAIQNLYNILYDLGKTNTESALKVGCMVEVTDINDLDKYIADANSSENNATDIVEAFKILRNGSYNHYWSFDKGLKNLGIQNGCYYEGDTLLTNKEGVYPINQSISEENRSIYGHGNRYGQQ